MTKKELIIQTALALFAAQGYEATSIQKLAEASGVAQGLLYRHFKNKEDLMQHLLAMGMQQIAETLEPYADKSIDFKEAFRQHITRCCNYMQQHPLLWKVLHAQRQYMAAQQQAAGIDIHKAVIAPIASKLRSGGYKRADATAWVILSLVDGMVAMYLLHPDAYPVEKVKKLLLEKIDSYAA